MWGRKILLERYLADTLGMRVTIHPWKGRNRLPFFLTATYDFHEVLLLGHSCLLMGAKENFQATPSELIKHQELVQQQWTGLCIYIPDEISAYTRKRLIEHQISFIVPGNQLYIPSLGMDLREHYQKQRSRTIHCFSPSTQAVVVHALCRAQLCFTPSELTRALGYTLMTMSRALDELEIVRLGEIRRKGKERWWQFQGSKRDLWDQAKPFMKTPVKKRTWANHKHPGAIAGLSALSHYSMLSVPRRSTYAIGPAQWRNWQQEGIEECPSADDALFDLEIWHYNPDLFTSGKSHVVDPFSLYLSLESSTDERVKLAISEMMEKIIW
jgi:hypothetical protein